VLVSISAGCGDDDDRARESPIVETVAAEVTAPPPPEPVGRWAPLPEAGAPVGRDGFAAGAFGRRVFVWGGHTVEGQFQTYLNGGAILDVADNRWIELGTEGAPSARVRHVAAFADSLLFVWGGRDGMNPLGDGGVYDPDARTWRATSLSGAPPPTSDGVAVFTGKEVLLFGGPIGAPSPRAGHTAVWTDDEFVVWGGIGPNGPLGDGARYDPLTDRWRPLSSTGAPSPRLRHVAVWTGDQMVVWGGDRNGAEPLGDGAAYVSSEDIWRALPSEGAPTGRTASTGTFLNGRVVIWGGESAEGLRADGAAFNPVTDTWSPLASEGAPAARRDHQARATDVGMVVWGGVIGEAVYTTLGGVFTL
jgi:hypothetical protein